MLSVNDLLSKYPGTPKQSMSSWFEAWSDADISTLINLLNLGNDYEDIDKLYESVMMNKEYDLNVLCWYIISTEFGLGYDKQQSISSYDIFTLINYILMLQPIKLSLIKLSGEVRLTDVSLNITIV